MIRKLLEEEKKRQRVGHLKALADAHMKKQRDGAVSTKRRLTFEHACPYCGGSLGERPHADHIHPVHKGGLSIPSNMVNVCQDCNIKKSNLTLNQFIKKYSLNQSDVFSRLEELGKDY